MKPFFFLLIPISWFQNLNNKNKYNLTIKKNPSMGPSDNVFVLLDVSIYLSSPCLH